MLKQEPLSPAQLQILIWAGLLAPVAEALPKLLLPDAGRNAWMSVLVGGLLALGLGRLLSTCGSCPARRLKEGLGRTGGTLALLLYIGWTQLLLALRLGLCADRLLLWGGRDGSRLFFLVVLTLLLLRLALSPLTAFARAGQIFFVALAAAALLILALALPAARPQRLLPMRPTPLSSALTAAGLLTAWAGPAVFLPVAYEGRPYKMRRDLLAVLLMTVGQAVILANLGAGLSEQVEVPFFTLAKSVGVEGAFQRAESAVAALWIFADLVLAGLLVNAQRQMLREVSRHETGLVIVLILSAALAAYWGTPARESIMAVLPILGILFALLLPLLIRLTEALRER